MTILFSESDHRYFIKEMPDKKLVSVSGLFDLVKPKFDSETLSKKYSEKPRETIIKDLGKKWGLNKSAAELKWGHLDFTPEVIRSIWEEKKKIGLERGTKWHKGIEEELLNKGNRKGTVQNGEYTEALDVRNLTPGEYIELVIPYLPQWLIGTADRVIIHDNKEFTIRDWKLDGEMNFESKAYFNSKTKESTKSKLLSPLQHIDNVNGMHYNVKESLYIYFLEGLGYKFKEGFIDHVVLNEGYDNDNFDSSKVKITSYPITYLKKEIETLLKWYSCQKQSNSLRNSKGSLQQKKNKI